MKFRCGRTKFSASSFVGDFNRDRSTSTSVIRTSTISVCTPRSALRPWHRKPSKSCVLPQSRKLRTSAASSERITKAAVWWGAFNLWVARARPRRFFALARATSCSGCASQTFRSPIGRPMLSIGRTFVIARLPSRQYRQGASKYPADLDRDDGRLNRCAGEDGAHALVLPSFPVSVDR